MRDIFDTVAAQMQAQPTPTPTPTGDIFDQVAQQMATPTPTPSQLAQAQVVGPEGQAIAPGGGDETSYRFVTPQAQDVAEARQLAQAPFVQGVAGEVAKVIPTSTGELARMIGESLLGTVSPITGEDISTYKKLYGMTQGEPMEEAFPAEKPFTEYGPEDWGRLVGRVGVSAAQAIPLIAGLRGPDMEIPSRAQPSVADAIHGLDQQPPPPASPELPAPVEPLEEPMPVPGSGKFRTTYQVDKELGDMMEGIGASKESGLLKGEIASRNMLNDLTPDQEADIGRYLVSRRLSTLNPSHPQILPPAEMARIESDPDIANALNTYRNEIKPDIEALRTRAGLTASAAAGKEPEFVSLLRTEGESTPDELLPTGAAVQQASRVPRTTRFAQRATGQAAQYSTNIGDILKSSYSEAMRKARVREFYDAAQRKGLTESADFGDLPPQLAHDLRAATEQELRPTGLAAAVRASQRLTTGLALSANPAELLNHMRRQLNIVASKPPIGRGLLSRLEAVVPYIGPKVGAFARTVGDNMSLPENQAILQDIFDAGGGSSRSFSEMYKSGVPGLKQVQGFTHNLLFGIPEGRGIGGWDLRMRVQLEKIRRAAEGNVDPQRIREFSNQIGQYGSHPDWFVRALRTINPYAATTLPMRLTELKTAAGTSGLKTQGYGELAGRQAETFLRGTGGTLLGLATANYMLSGKWPWENDPGHESDLNTGITGADGKRLYVKLRVIAPELSRPVATAAIPNLSREKTAEQPQYVSAFLTGLANQGLSIVSGPAQDALLTALTGKVPYLTKAPGEKPDLMDVVRTKYDESGRPIPMDRGLEQLKYAAAAMNPLGQMFVEEGYKPNVPYPLNYVETPVPGVRPLGTMFSESYEAKPPKTAHSIGDKIRMQKAAASRRRHAAARRATQ